MVQAPRLPRQCNINIITNIPSAANQHLVSSSFAVAVADGTARLFSRRWWHDQAFTIASATLVWVCVSFGVVASSWRCFSCTRPCIIRSGQAAAAAPPARTPSRTQQFLFFFWSTGCESSSTGDEECCYWVFYAGARRWVRLRLQAGAGTTKVELMIEVAIQFSKAQTQARPRPRVWPFVAFYVSPTTDAFGAPSRCTSSCIDRPGSRPPHAVSSPSPTLPSPLSMKKSSMGRLRVGGISSCSSILLSRPIAPTFATVQKKMLQLVNQIYSAIDVYSISCRNILIHRRSDDIVRRR